MILGYHYLCHRRIECEIGREERKAGRREEKELVYKMSEMITQGP